MNEGESFHGVDPSLHGHAVQRPQEPEIAPTDTPQAVEPEAEIVPQIEPQRVERMAATNRTVTPRGPRLQNDQKRDKRVRAAKKK